MMSIEEDKPKEENSYKCIVNIDGEDHVFIKLSKFNSMDIKLTHLEFCLKESEKELEELHLFINKMYGEGKL